MPDIKTRDVVKGTIKTLDRSAALGERMKEAYVRTKEKGENAVASSDSSADEYAADQLTGGVDAMTHEAVQQVDQQGHRIVRASGNAASKAQEQFRKNRQEQQTERFRNASGGEEPHLASDDTPRVQRDDFSRVEPKAPSARSNHAPSQEAPPSKIKTRDNQADIQRIVKTREKPVIKSARATVKTTSKTVKTADAAARTTIKTAQASAESAQKASAAAARAAKFTAQGIERAAQASATAAKATADAVRAIIAGTKALVSAIGAGGWVAVAVIVVICLIGLIVGSCFGIFFSGEDTSTG